MPPFASNAVWITQTGVNAGGLANFAATNLLIQAGWTVVASGDGVGAYDPGGDVITSGSAVPNGYGNQLAWRVLENEVGNQISIQVITVGGTNSTARIKYSPFDGFSVGGSTNETPFAADEAVLKGGGTDAAPTGNVDVFSYDPNDIMVGGAETIWPYRFFFGIVDVSVANLTPFFPLFRDYVWPGNSVINQLDPDPTVIGTGRVTSAFNAFDAFIYVMANNNDPGSAGALAGWYDSGMRFCRIDWYGGTNPQAVPVGQAISPYDGLFEIIPFSAVRNNTTNYTAPRGLKGWVRERYLRAPSLTISGTVACRLLNVDGGTRNFILLGLQVFPWNGQAVAGIPDTTNAAIRFPLFDEQAAEYRMRGRDPGSGEYIYWNATVPMPTLAFLQLNPRPPLLLDIVVDRVLRL